MKTYLEFNDGKSYKFWEITVDGNNHTVTYGKIGTDGQTKTKEFDSPEASNKDAEKLIKGKKKKGYKEKTEKSEKKISRRVAVHYEEEEEGKTIKMKLEKLAADPKAKEMTDLTIGSWESAAENTSAAIISFLVDNKSAFPNLKSVYIGDMNYEECEISWIQQSDMTPLLEAYPGLEELRIKGSEGLQFSKLNHGALKSIIIECGGLGKDVLKTIAGATLPALEHLELYLGVEHYGFDGGLEDILPFLKKDLFPKLKVLGLRDSDIADDIAKAAAGADVLDQIEVLDLSLGTLSDKGAEAFLSSEKIKKLKKLDLHYHYMSDDMIKKLRKLGITIDAGDPQGSETHEDDRYPNVTE